MHGITPLEMMSITVTICAYGKGNTTSVKKKKKSGIRSGTCSGYQSNFVLNLLCVIH